MWNLKKKKKLTETEIRLMADRGGRDGEILVKRNSFSSKMRKFWGSNVEHSGYSQQSHTTSLKGARRVNPFNFILLKHP